LVRKEGRGELMDRWDGQHDRKARWTDGQMDSCFLSASSPPEFSSINYHKIFANNFLLSFFFKEGEGLRKIGTKIW